MSLKSEISTFEIMNTVFSNNQTILILENGGQIGSDDIKVESIYGNKNVITSDIKSYERLFNLEGSFEIDAQ